MSCTTQRRPGLLLSSEQFLATYEPAQMPADCVGETILRASLPQPVINRLLRSRAARAHGFALVEEHPDARGAVLTVETVGLQMVFLVPLVFQWTRAWLVEGVELRRHFTLALQATDSPRVDLVRIEEPVAHPEEQAWQSMHEWIAADPPEELHLAQLMQLATLVGNVEGDSRSLLQRDLRQRWIIAFAPDRRSPQRLRQDAQNRQQAWTLAWSRLAAPARPRALQSTPGPIG